MKLRIECNVSGENMTAWRDQVALVTGGARGIGRATARLLAQRGAAVCVNYAAHADAADGLAGEIVADGGRAISAMADVAEPSAVEAMVARIEKDLGPLTILVNNAGVSWRGTLDTYDPEQVARMRQVNVEGLIHATRAVIGGMRARRRQTPRSSIRIRRGKCYSQTPSVKTNGRAFSLVVCPAATRS